MPARLTDARPRSPVLVALAALLASALAACAPAVTPAVTPAAAPARAPLPAAAAVPVPPHDTFTVQSRALGEPRPVNVWTPAAYRASPARLPVLYMPDGGLDEDFPHVVHTVDSLIARGAIRPVIVVGIPNTARRRDLTGPTRRAADSAIAPRVGGSAAFRRFLDEELVPAVEARYRTTGERGLVGESLAGLFVVETFLAEPTRFTHYVALDPSVWWDGGSLVDSAGPRVAAYAALAARDPTPRTLYLATSKDGADGLVDRLEAMLRAAAPPGLRLVYAPRPDLTHPTIFRGIEGPALADALR